MRLDQLERSSPVDSWLLKAHNKFRIQIPKDENCLYKAVAEQLYPCQNYYQKVKDRCFSYSTSNGVEDFEGLTTSEKLEIVSKVYQRNVILFSTEGKEPITVGKFSGTKMDIFLRADEDGFFECIKSIEYMKTAAFCQSLVYEKLYESFGVSKREQHQAIANVRTKVYNIHQKNYGSYDNKNHSTLQEGADVKEMASPTPSGVPIGPPFPFRVVKSLDPSFYRNSQYDLWIDSKKVIEQKIKQGDKVFVKQASSESMDEQCIGHVQKISDDSSTADVYVEKISGVLSLDTSLITKVPTPKHHSTKGRRDKLSPEGDNSNRPLHRSQSAPLPGLPATPISPHLATNFVNIPVNHCYPITAMHSQQPHVQSVPTTNVINIGPTYSQERLPSVFPVVGPSYPPMQMMYSGNSNQSATAAEYYAAPSQPLAQPATVPAQYSAPAVSVQQPYHHLPPSPPQYSVVVPPASQYYANSTTGYETLCHKSPQESYNQSVATQPSVFVPGQNPQSSGLLVVPQPPPQHPSFLPFVVPYQGTYGLVNVNAAPSQDQQGRDLPQNDGNTLRYFFNVGIACTSYFRNIAANAMHNNRISSPHERFYQESASTQ